MEEEQIKETKEQSQEATSNADGENEIDYDKEDLNCRFYRDELPNSEQLVVVSIN